MLERSAARMHHPADRVPEDGTPRRAAPRRPLPSAIVDDTFSDPSRATRVRALAPAIDELFAGALGELGAPGLAYGVALDGELVHAGGCGVRSIESGDVPGPDTAFRICSMTKSFTATAVLSLRDEGRLDIDAPLGDVAPALQALAQAGPDAPPVTVRQLLTMDAGLPQDDPWADRLMGDDSDWVAARAVHARRHALARARDCLRVLQLRLGGARPRDLDRHRQALPGRHPRARDRARSSLRDTVWTRRRPPGGQVATGYRRAGDGFTAEVPVADGGDFAALGGPLLERARPRALERRLPGTPSRRATRPRPSRSAARRCGRWRVRAARSRPPSSGRRWPSRPASWPGATATASWCGTSATAAATSATRAACPAGAR